jgi:hypothetical protein
MGESPQSLYHNASELHIYNPSTNTWRIKITKNDSPTDGTSSQAPAQIDSKQNLLYIYGGYRKHNNELTTYAGLSILNLNTYRWSLGKATVDSEADMPIYDSSLALLNLRKRYLVRLFGKYFQIRIYYIYNINPFYFFFFFFFFFK